MTLSGFTLASCYTWDYVTSSRERHSSSVRFLLPLCVWIKAATILLCSQPPKTSVMLTRSRVLHIELSH